jgi:hypothetical protein
MFYRDGGAEAVIGHLTSPPVISNMMVMVHEVFGDDLIIVNVDVGAMAPVMGDASIIAANEQDRIKAVEDLQTAGFSSDRIHTHWLNNTTPDRSLTMAYDTHLRKSKVQIVRSRG